MISIVTLLAYPIIPHVEHLVREVAGSVFMEVRIAFQECCCYNISVVEDC